MMNRIRNAIEDNGTATTATIAAWYTISNVLTKGMAFISTPIFTRLLSQSEYGQINNFTSWQSLLVVFVTLNFTESIARAKYNYNERLDEYMSSILLFSNIVTVLFYFIVELNSRFFVEVFSMDIRLIRLMFLYFLAEPAYRFLQIKQRLYRKYKAFVLVSVLTTISSTIISVILVLIMPDKLLGRVIGMTIPCVLINLFLWYEIISKSKRVYKDCLKYALKISIPLIPSVLSSTILNTSDRIMITKLCSQSDTALYSLAYSVSALASLIWFSMNSAWGPWLYDNLNSNNKMKIRSRSKLYLLVFTAVIIGVYLIAPEIVLILGGRFYYSAINVMPPVILGCAFQFVYGMYYNIEFFVGKNIEISISSSGVALINIILNVIFIPRYGYIAAAYTTAVSYGILLLFHYTVVTVKVRQFSDVYNEKYIWGTCILFIVLTLISYQLYKNSTIRYAVLALYCIIFAAVILKNKGTIFDLFGLKNWKLHSK